MPESRARTAICSAPFEWPSRPGLPTRIFGRRPSFSCSRETSSRSSLNSPSAGAAAASPTPAGVPVSGRRLDQEDAALGAGGEGGALRLASAVRPADSLAAALHPAAPLVGALRERRLHVGHGLDGAAVLGHDGHLLARAL